MNINEPKTTSSDYDDDNDDDGDSDGNDNRLALSHIHNAEKPILSLSHVQKKKNTHCQAEWNSWHCKDEKNSSLQEQIGGFHKNR